jgi:PAS domain S-box-containing protein
MTDQVSRTEQHQLLDRIVHSIQDFGWNTVVLVLRDETARSTYPVAGATRDPDLKRYLETQPRTPFRPDSWRNEDYRISRSFFVDHRLHSGVEKFADETGRGMYRTHLGQRETNEWHSDDFLVVPLQIDDKDLGWLSVDDPVDRQRPTLEKVRALEVFADQAALIIQQNRQYQQVRVQVIRQTVLNEIAHTISQHLEIAELFTAITEQLRQIFPFQRASIRLREAIYAIDEEQNLSSDSGPLEDLAYSQLIQKSEPHLLSCNLDEDRTLDEEKLLHEAGVRSYMCLPLIMWGQVIGAFNLSSSTIDAFCPADIDFLKQIAEHIAGAVWNALLYELEQKRRHTADALVQLSKIVNSTLELEEVLTLALEQLARVIDYDSSSILLLEGDMLTITAARGFQDSAALVGASFRMEENNISHRVLKSRQVRIEPDVQKLPEWGHNRDDMEGAHTIRGWMGVPLIVRDTSIGMLAIDKYQADFYTDEDAENASAFATQISTAIQNARLYKSENRKRQTAAALAQMAQIVNSTLEMKEVLELALEQLAQVVHYDTASILLVEEPNLVIAACRGFQNPGALLGSIITPDEVNLGYQVLLSQQTRIIGDAQQEMVWGHMRDYVSDMLAIRGWIGAPLIARGQSIGVLTIDKHQPDFYTEEDAAAASAFAAHIATALQNASLFEALQLQRNRLSAILTDTTDAVIVLDDKGLIWLLNPAAERYLKVERARMIGQPVNALNLPDFTAAFDAVRKTGQPSTTEVAGPDGNALNASIAPVHQVGWVVVMQDITPLKELDRLRTEWVAAVSHDLKNPIQVVQLGAVLLEMDGPLNDMQQDRIAIIQRNAEQLSDMVTNVLDLARLEAGPSLRLAPINLLNLIQSTLADLEHLASKKQQALKADLETSLPSIMGDQALLARVVTNLLSNAIKYTPPGGLITIRAHSSGTFAEIEVIDNGPGIPDEALPHLFDRFYRVPGTKAEGTGLGLSIVKSIVEKHNGTVRVVSTQGQGSNFILSLPTMSA